MVDDVDGTFDREALRPASTPHSFVSYCRSITSTSFNSTVINHLPHAVVSPRVPCVHSTHAQCLETSPPRCHKARISTLPRLLESPCLHASSLTVVGREASLTSESPPPRHLSQNTLDSRLPRPDISPQWFSLTQLTRHALDHRTLRLARHNPRYSAHLPS